MERKNLMAWRSRVRVSSMICTTACPAHHSIRFEAARNSLQYALFLHHHFRQQRMHACSCSNPCFFVVYHWHDKESCDRVRRTTGEAVVLSRQHQQ